MFTHYATITILNTQVDADLTDFPMLVSGTYDGTGGEPDLRTTGNGGKVQNTNGYDIIFTSDAAGLTKLDHEIEGYTASTGELIAWVRVPSVSNSIDTVIYMWFGNPYMNTSQENKRAVWDANYKGVWHLGLNGSLSTYDSTENNNGANGGASSETGKVGACAGFNGSSYIQIPHSSFLSINGNLTIEAWVKLNSNSTQQRIVSKWGDNSSEYHFLIELTASGKAQFARSRSGGSGSVVCTGATTLNTTDWYHLAGLWDGSLQSIFVNGVSDGSTSSGDAVVARTTNLRFGHEGDASGSLYFNGLIDGVRISNTNRSAEWITTQINNQNSPSTFYTMGSSNQIQYPSIGGILSMGNILSIKMTA